MKVKLINLSPQMDSIQKPYPMQDRVYKYAN